MRLKPSSRPEIVRELVLKCRLLQRLLLLMSQIALNILKVSSLGYVEGIDGLSNMTKSATSWVSSRFIIVSPAPVRACTVMNGTKSNETSMLINLPHAQISDSLHDVITHEGRITIIFILISIATRKILRVRRTGKVVHHHIILVLLMLIGLLGRR